MAPRMRCTRPAFTLVELLVVIAVVAILIGVLLPALSSARRSAQSVASAANIRQIGAATLLYLNEHRDHLPQMRIDPAGNPVRAPEGNNIGTLFAGKFGTLPFYGLTTIGPERRPLNPYIWDGPLPSDDTPEARDFELEIFRDPTDAGFNDPFLTAQGFDTSSLYDLLGISYALNDHALDDSPGDEPYDTLIPKPGGRMPRIADPTLTWLVGTQPIYNYDSGSDRDMRWGGRSVTATLFYADGHARSGVPVAKGIIDTTNDYTFLPNPDWMLHRFGIDPESRR
ncbi:MAG: type II secretion system protein [Phycisphaeraceae bacterium]|nr:MAG: type II secretion system protein [Phycisphaeraceae bacterium]